MFVLFLLLLLFDFVFFVLFCSYKYFHGELLGYKRPEKYCKPCANETIDLPMYVGIIMLKGMLKCLLCKKGIWQNYKINEKGEVVVFVPVTGTVSQAAAVISQGTPWICVNFMVTPKLRDVTAPRHKTHEDSRLILDVTRSSVSFSGCKATDFLTLDRARLAISSLFLTKRCYETGIYPLTFFILTCFLLSFNKASVMGPNFHPFDR